MNKYFEHFMKYQKIYLTLLALIILITPTFINLFIGKPLLSGSESYYNLQQAKTLTHENFDYFPLSLTLKLLPADYLFVIPLTLALISLFLIFVITEGTKIRKDFKFFFLLFVILSPVFIYTFTTISQNSYLIFLIILGFYFLTRKNSVLRYLSIIPFIVSSFFDIISTMLVILSLLVHIYLIKKRRKIVLINLIFILISSLINIIFLGQTFFPMQFHQQNFLTGLLADLGGVHGVSFFVFLLAIIGLTITWKKKYFSISYLFLLVLIPACIFNSELAFLVSILLTFFATVAFVFFLNKKWDLENIKRFTYFILLLGILFSTISYLDRFSENYPLNGHEETLSWISENTPVGTIILSSSENVHYLNYFTDGKPFHLLYKDQAYTDENYAKITTATHINTLENLLNVHKIELIYVTPDMKQVLPADYGILVLLQNENFKLVHSHNEFEVWVYLPNIV
jgi:hypothetical protein